MDFEEVYEKQKKLDKKIVDKYNNQNGFDMGFEQKHFLVDRLLALSVEVSELANATREFKYWSTKESESKERLLDEFADIIHFVFSVADSLDFTVEEIEAAYLKKHEENYRRQEEGY
jgi:Uncharacterized protein conserved in bacteria